MPKDERLNIAAMLVIIGAVFVLIALNPSTSADQAKTFSSYQQLSDFLKERSEPSYGGGMLAGGMRGMEELAVVPTAMPGAATTDTGTKSTDYSTTNIQVEGVDEPDMVKSDGKYIYTTSSDGVAIIDAYPAQNMKVTSNISIDGSVSNMFINGNKLVVFGNNYGYWGGPRAVGGSGGVAATDVAIMPYYRRSMPGSFIYVYDVSDHFNPTLVRNISLEGSYYDARMIGDYAYAIVQQPVRMIDSGPVLPLLTVGAQAKEIAPGEITYFDEYDTSFVYTFVIALNTQDDAEQQNEKVFLMGYGQNLYVSQDNIYSVYTKYLSQTEVYRRLIEQGILPNVPSDLQVRIRVVQGSNATIYEKMSQIGSLIQDYAGKLGPEGGATFMRNLEEKIQAVQLQMERESEKTVIQKIAISGPEVEYRTGGEVPGRVLNQFSMDEFNGNFRIATTTGQSWSGSSVNNMYVLDQNIGVIGRLENLAQGEQIYSVRFMGERAYMVTFHRTDPLFAIDLSNPASPKVLGELKMPGFSDYLHPVDSNHLIGLGQMANEDGRLTGQVKLSLFDVSDVSNPREISSYLIGEQGDWAYSEALDDHKAFLFSQSKGLLAIPVSVNNWHTDKYFQGAYVFDFSLENGFGLKGKVTHVVTNASAEERYYDYGTAVRRSLYMDDTFYTVSNSMIMANNMADLSEIASVTFSPAQRGYPVVY